MPKAKNKARADGRLQSKVYLGNGKYKYVYAQNKRELEKKVEEIKIRLGKGLDVNAERDTFGYWLDKWLKYKESDVSQNWHDVLAINAKKLAAIEYEPITKLRAVSLQEILIELAKDGYSRRVLKAVRDIAIGTVDYAIENRVLDYNPFTFTHIPANAKEPEKRRALTLAEQSWIVNTPHRAQLPAMIMMYAGLRRGELFALRWSDIDLAAGTITVNKSVVMHNGKPEAKSGGKTKAATRTVYIPKVLIDFLAVQPRTSLLVVTTTTGQPMTVSAWRRLWDSYMCELNLKYGDFLVPPKSKYQPGGVPMVIPAFTAHWLRHTFVTNMYNAGVDVAIARDQAGHSDIKTTLEIYTTLDKENRRSDMAKLNDYIGVSDGCQAKKQMA